MLGAAKRAFKVALYAHHYLWYNQKHAEGIRCWSQVLVR